MNQSTGAVEIKITQDKLVDLLLHAATREDIASLRQKMEDNGVALQHEMKADAVTLRQETKADVASLRQEIKENTIVLQQKIEENTTILRQEMKENTTILRQEMKENTTGLQQEMAAARQDIKDAVFEFKNSNNAFEARVNSHFRWVIGTVIAATLTIIGVSLSLANFLTHYINHA